MITPAYLRKADAAKYLLISPRTFSMWQRRGLIAYSKPARKVCLIAVADLDKMVRRFRINAIGE